MSNHPSGYAAIADALTALIRSGRLAPGEKILSEAELCKAYKVSRQTVRHALEVLQKSHLIETRRAVGSFVAEGCAARGPEPQGSAAKVVGVITPFMDSYIFPNQIDGIESVLTGHGYAVRLGVTYNKIDNEARILKSMLGQDLGGVIAEPTASALPPVNAGLYRALYDRGVPILFVNAYLPDLPIPCVCLDDRRGGYLATRHLIETGHRKIAYIGRLDSCAGHLRYAGYTDALIEEGIPIDEAQIVWFSSGSMGDLFAPALSEYLLGKLRACSAVFCYNDQIACTLIEVLRLNDIRIPEDMSIVGYDDSDYARQSTPPCTTIAHPSHSIGVAAADRILEMMTGGRAVASRLFDPVLVKRRTVSAPPQNEPDKAP